MQPVATVQHFRKSIALHLIYIMFSIDAIDGHDIFIVDDLFYVGKHYA